MIKKTRLFGIFFSVNILLPFNLLAVSCSKTKTESDTTSTSSTSESEKEAQSFSSEIKDFVKKGITPQGNQSILTIDDLLNEIDFTDTQQAKLAKLRETEVFLDQLADNLNKNIEDEDFKVELKNNKVVEEGIKKIIHKNCEKTSGLLKKTYSDEFAEASVSKILELEEGSLIFNLKKFSLSKIFRDIEDEDLKFDEDQKAVFAESDKLKIYNINIDLTTNLSSGNSKKNAIVVKDINLFIALNQEKANLLKEGITTYLQNKFNQSITSIYLDGKHRGGRSSAETSDYFPKITKEKNYNLLDDVNKQQIMSYLSDNYLPGLIYKNKNTNVEKPVMIKSKDLILEQSDLNFSLEGMKIPDGLKSQITFLNFFGVNNQTQIKETHIKEIKTEHFLKDATIYEGKYYSLGSGSLEINDWNIKGFPINQITVKFKIYIRKEILDTEVSDLKIVLRNVLEIMKTSRVSKLVGTASVAEGKYALQIDSGVNQRRGTANLSSEVTFDHILNTLYTEPAKERSKGNFGGNISNVPFFKFSTGNDYLTFKTTNNFKYSIVGRNTRQNEPLNIYFMFNTSFKIKLNDELLVERTKNTVVDAENNTNNEENNHHFYIR